MDFEIERKDYRFSGEKPKLHTPVLLIFFNRPEVFFKVFEEVRKARPAELFLYQDGPRKGRDDETGIALCREVLQKIDWECEVHTWFRKKNCGCDPSEYLSQKWAFSAADRCIVLEDDDVPSQSFFLFCEELLEKYKDDDRIAIISGMNTLGTHREDEADYFFSTMCSIWGWASWKRVVDRWNDRYEFLSDAKTVENLMELRKNTQIEELLHAAKNHRAQGKAYYESILSSEMFLNHQFNIVPSKNLISNIGLTGNSTHATNSVEKLPHGIRRVFNMKTYSYSFPLKAPAYMVEDMDYQKKVKRIMGWGYPLVQRWRQVDSVLSRLLYRLRHGKE